MTKVLPFGAPSETILRTFGERVLYCRKQAQLTQAQLAKLAGKSQGAVNMWETKSSVPKPDDLVKLAKLFDVQVGWLLEGGRNPVVAKVQAPDKQSSGASAFIGVSSVQQATLETLHGVLRRGLISNSECLALMVKWQELLDAETGA